jgi:ATP-citrate lyase beta-subunit
MARQRISEYRAKHLLAGVFGQPYAGVELDRQGDWRRRLAELESGRYTIKVDQAVKGRYKRGLVALDVPPARLAAAAQPLFDQGYRYLLAEPYVPHDPSHERYLAIRRLRPGVTVMFGALGGTEVEHNSGSVRQAVLKPSSASAAARTLGLPPDVVKRMGQLFQDHHLSFLEINPLMVANGSALPLDAAAVADDAATALVSGSWTPADFRSPAGASSPAEAEVAELDARTPSSFVLKVLNPEGRIFVLLSGGGASLVVADEICHQGAGQWLANYGEYSGDPSASEVHAYTRQVLALLLASPARPKVLIIAGGVANFTDISVTFSGLIAALEEVSAELRRQGVKVFVRRGGPAAAAGLEAMRAYLESAGLLGSVAGPEQPLAGVVSLALGSLAKAKSA